jgi:chemotaxis response regulator CheB
MRTSLQGSEGARGGLQRVLVVNNSSLLGEGIESILRSDSELLIQGITTNDEANLFKKISEYNPDVIVMVEDTTPFDANRILLLFDQFPRLRIVGVSLQSGDVRAYDKTQVTITQPVDFLEIIKGCPNGRGSGGE